MRIISRFCFFLAATALALLSGCSLFQLPPPTSATIYHVTAHRPHDPSNVRVDVSLSKQNVYVMEGSRCLMAVATSVGMNIHPTPKGHFHITSKIEYKRSGAYGFCVQGEKVRAA